MFPILAATAVWFLILILAIANGVLREVVLNKRLDSQRSHQLSSLILSLLILPMAGLFVHFFGRSYPIGAMWATGFYWLMLTVAFEFLFGHYVAKHSWERLLADYNLMQGRLWVLVLLATLLAPVLCYRLLV